MEITKTFQPANRAEWRAWLAENHGRTTEIWLVTPDKQSGNEPLSYLDAVEEALCFGWIDGIAKRLDSTHLAQRFTPRKPKSHWTELNKERARRLIAAGQMTPAGAAILPDLDPDHFQIAADILAALQADSQTWTNFSNFPALYQRIRIGYIEEMRKQPVIFQQRLAHFLKKTKQGKQFGTVQ